MVCTAPYRECLSAFTPIEPKSESGVLEGHQSYNPIVCCYNHRILSAHHPEIGVLLVDIVSREKQENSYRNDVARAQQPQPQVTGKKKEARGKRRASRRKSIITTTIPVDDRW